LVNQYTTKVRVDPGFRYTDCEGFTRYKFFSKSSPQNFTLSSFNVTTTYWDSHPRSKRIVTSTPATTEEPLKLPTCWRGDFCDYLFQSLITRRLAEPTLTAPLEDDKDNPRHQCGRATQCGLGISRELVLIHWRTSSQDHGSPRCFNTPARFVSTTNSYALPRTFSTDAITFRGLELWLGGVIEEPGTTSSVLRINFTFTSPTVYIAHHAIVSTLLSGKKRPERTIISAGIIPVNATDIYTSSLMIPDVTEWARRIGRGETIREPRNIRPNGALKRLDFADLHEPVPATAYYSHNVPCWFGGAACATLTDGNFRPTLYLHDRIYYSLLHWDEPGHEWKPDDCHLPKVWDPDIEVEPLPGEPPPDPNRKRRFVSLPTDVLASATAVDGLAQGQMTKDPAMTIATQTAYHVSATRTFIPQETNRIL
jgi:hypothetical protein